MKIMKTALIAAWACFIIVATVVIWKTFRYEPPGGEVTGMETGPVGEPPASAAPAAPAGAGAPATETVEPPVPVREVAETAGTDTTPAASASPTTTVPEGFGAPSAAASAGAPVTMQPGIPPGPAGVGSEGAAGTEDRGEPPAPTATATPGANVRAGPTKGPEPEGGAAWVRGGTELAGRTKGTNDRRDGRVAGASPVPLGDPGYVGASPVPIGDPGYAGASPVTADGETGEPDPAAVDDTSPAAEPWDSDSAPPVVTAIRIEPPTIEDGQATTIYVEVTDDISGVKSVQGTLRSPSGKSYQAFHCRLDQVGGLFSGKVSVPKDAESGVWQISTMMLKDNANNQQTLVAGNSPVLAQAVLNVSSTGSDSTPPEVTLISLPTTPLTDGENFTFRVEARDDLSGVASIWGSFTNPQRTSNAGFTARPLETSGVFEASALIPKKAETGEWRIKFLQVSDKAGNRKSYQESDDILASAVVYVASSESDSTPPTLSSIQVQPKTVNRKEALTITVDVMDEGSGPKSVVGWARNPARTAKLIFSCMQQEDTKGRFIGTLLIPENAQVGMWYIDTVHLYDKANNLKLYVAERDAELNEATFEVH